MGRPRAGGMTSLASPRRCMVAAEGSSVHETLEGFIEPLGTEATRPGASEEALHSLRPQCLRGCFSGEIV